jgi:hypothetical protein
LPQTVRGLHLELHEISAPRVDQRLCRHSTKDLHWPRFRALGQLMKGIRARETRLRPGMRIRPGLSEAYWLLQNWNGEFPERTCEGSFDSASKGEVPLTLVSMGHCTIHVSHACIDFPMHLDQTGLHMPSSGLTPCMTASPGVTAQSHGRGLV